MRANIHANKRPLRGTHVAAVATRKNTESPIDDHEPTWIDKRSRVAAQLQVVKDAVRDWALDLVHVSTPINLCVANLNDYQSA